MIGSKLLKRFKAAATCAAVARYRFSGAYVC